jgi:ribosomal 30S subunit maturation factor RimM
LKIPFEIFSLDFTSSIVSTPLRQRYFYRSKDYATCAQHSQRRYTDQILGMKVQTETGRDLDEVEEILETPAHDIYCTSQVMIPAVPEYILKRDFESNVIIVPDSVEWDE